METQASQITMALFIPHRCPKCFESVTLIQPQYKGGAFKGPARGQCLNCMDEQEYDLNIPVNRRNLVHALISGTEKLQLKMRGNYQGQVKIRKRLTVMD